MYVEDIEAADANLVFQVLYQVQQAQHRLHYQLYRPLVILYNKVLCRDERIQSNWPFLNFHIH